MTGVIPRRPQVRDRGGLIDWPHSSSKTIQPPRAAAVLSSAARPPSSTPPPRSHRARWPGARRSGRSSRGGAEGTRSPGWCTAPGTCRPPGRGRGPASTAGPAIRRPAGRASSATSCVASCCSSSRHCATCPREASPAGSSGRPRDYVTNEPPRNRQPGRDFPAADGLMASRPARHKFMRSDDQQHDQLAEDRKRWHGARKRWG